MIEVQEGKFIGSIVFSGYSGVWLDLEDQDEQREQLYAQMMGWTE